MFLIKLDRMPTWEDRLTIYITSLVDLDRKPQTIQSYMNAIKAFLWMEDIIIRDDTYTLSALTRACKLKNNSVTVRLPIQKGLLGMIFDKINEFYNRSQPYLACLYKAMMSTGYYGFLRVSEMTCGEHVINVKGWYMSNNRKKALLVLRSSKTHSRGYKPQLIKIQGHNINPKGFEKDRHCPMNC